MRQFLLVVVSAAAISACSEGRERRVLSIDSTLDMPDLTLPDTVTRRDTSAAVATRSEPPASPVKPKAAVKPDIAPAKPATVARRKLRKPEAPKTSTADTSVQAYAPGRVQDSTPRPEPRVKIDSAAGERDTITASTGTEARAQVTPTPPRDTTRNSIRDTVRREVDTIRAAAATPSPADTMTTSPIETATPSVAATSPSRTDTGAAPAERRSPRPVETTSRPTDTASAPIDTTSTPPADTMVGNPPAEAPAQPNRSASELAARTLRVGTQIHAQLNDSITSRRDTVGQIVSAHVMENVIGPNGRTLIPAGAPVRFTITRLRPSRSKSSQGRLGLRVDSIEVNGRLETVKAETRPVPRELRGRGVTPEDAAKVGGGAAAGAVIGGVVGGNARGAVIGGVAGAAAGAVLATQTKTRDVVVKAKTPVVFVLTAPLVVAP